MCIFIFKQLISLKINLILHVVPSEHWIAIVLFDQSYWSSYFWNHVENAFSVMPKIGDNLTIAIV